MSKPRFTFILYFLTDINMSFKDAFECELLTGQRLLFQVASVGAGCLRFVQMTKISVITSVPV